jgi:stearoyl-CoA desaturase (Delta-9 desaturase)
MSDIKVSCKKELNWPSIAVLGSLHLVGLLSLVCMIRQPPSIKIWVLFSIFMVIPQLGITVTYHRGETHGGFKWVHNWPRAIFLVLGAMAAQGAAYAWILNHRVHHKFQDVRGMDPHTPREYNGLKGVLWAHMGWLLCKYERPDKFRKSSRMDEDRLIQWQQRWYVPLLVSGFVLPLAIGGWNGLLVAGFFRVVCSLHCSWAVNSIGHWFGTRAKDSRGKRYLADDSRNNLGLAIVTLGEGYHANHHADQGCAYHGWKWYHFDPSKWMIRTMELVRLIQDVNKPNKLVVFRDDQLTPPEAKQPALQMA